MYRQFWFMQHVDRKDPKVPTFFVCRDLCGGGVGKQAILRRPLFHFMGLLIFQTGRFPIFDFHLARQVVGSREGDENEGSKNNPTNLGSSDGGGFPGNRLYFGIVQGALDIHRVGFVNDERFFLWQKEVFHFLTTQIDGSPPGNGNVLGVEYKGPRRDDPFLDAVIGHPAT